MKFVARNRQIVNTIANEAIFLNPRVDAKNCVEVVAVMAGRSKVVEALVPRACKRTGGWHNRLYNL